MSHKNFIGYGIILSSAALLFACGGSSDTSTTDTSSSTTSGAITAFGSIYVNGKEIHTDNASIYIEDEAASESDLRVGMMVHVTESSDGVAASVHHDDDIEGIVLSNNIAAGTTTGTMNIMGHTVTIDENTIFESYVNSITTYSDIVAGNIVEVSGYSAGMGDITATRIEVKATDLADYISRGHEYIEFKGIVQNHSGNTFDIGMMTVDYASAILDGMSSISDGMYVEVKSTQGIDTDTGYLIASKVELENDGSRDHYGDEDDEYEVEGKVVAITDTSITVGSDTFILNDSTEYEYGDKTAIMVGMMVEVEGYYNSENQLVAKEVEIEEYDNLLEFTDTVSAVESTEANVGTITLNGGQVIHVNADTIMHDDSSMDHEQFNITQMNQGDLVEVYCYDNGDGTYTATKVERK